MEKNDYSDEENMQFHQNDIIIWHTVEEILSTLVE